MPKQQPGWVKSTTTKNQLTVTWRDPKELIMYAKNSKLHPPEQIQQIANSITEFGFLDPIAIDENGEILEGHGRYLAAVEILNLKSVPTFQVLGLTEEQKIAYRVAHNKLTMNTDFDPDLLKIDMDFLNEMSFDLTLTGFDSEDLSSYLSLENTEYQEKEVVVDKGRELSSNDKDGSANDNDKDKDTENESGKKTLADKFIVPPFSVLDARQGYWQKRKREWLALGIQSELGRGDQLIPNGGGMSSKARYLAVPSGSLMPSMSYSKDHTRGDSKGRAIP
jgi:hypothetical protein